MSRTLIEWYRIDRSQTMRRVLIAAVSSMATGSFVVGLSFLTRQSEGMRVVAAIVGFVCVVMGPLIALVGLRGSLIEDLYLVVRVDGMLMHLEGEAPAALVRWDAIERIVHDPVAHAVVLRMRSGEQSQLTKPFAGITMEALARRLDECRRKADFQLLR